MERLQKSKEKICYEIHEVGKSIIAKMERLNIKDITIICKDPNNASLKGEDMKEG